MKYFITDQVVLSRPPEGLLAAQIVPFAHWLRAQGYTVSTLHHQVLLAADFSRWLQRKGVSVQEVCTAHPGQYLNHRARRRCIGCADAPALRRFMAFLRGEGIIPAEPTRPPPTTPAEQCVQEFARYLREERLLANVTIMGYVPFIRGLLTERFADQEVQLSDLSASDVVGFVQRQAPKLHIKQAKRLTTALRAFLRYARYRGEISADLAAAVPTVASWSMSTIPRAIPAEQLRKLLARAGRRTATERRDYAILLLLARLGLRASEVVFLELDDIDWAAGCLTVRHNKGNQCTQLPLPTDVGEAIVAYLRHGRPPSTSRRVFLRARAPIGDLRSSGAIRWIVYQAIERAGVDAPTRGAHQFRHALATQMLGDGNSLPEIGAVLGHRSPQTTLIYAKVDLDALRTLALPWPGGAQ